MSLRVRFSAVLIALGLVAPIGKGAQAEDIVLTLATGGVAGVYFPLGEALAMVWSGAVDGLSVEAEPTGGSVANVFLVHEGEAELAFVQNDIARYAADATEMFEGQAPLDGYLGLAMLYPEPVQIVALADSGLASVADLEGERVAVGAWGSGTEANARQILEAHGLSYDDIQPVFMAFDEAVVALGDGLIQAAFLTAGVPTAAVTDLIVAYRNPATIVPLALDRIEEIIERWPHYAPHTIPSGTYPGIDADSPTVAVVAMLVASRDLHAEAIEMLLERLFAEATLRRLCGIHARGCDISLETARAAMPIPLHPGAERFYEQAQ